MTTARFPIFISCRDRITSLLQLIDWLERAGQDVIYLVDNDSQWPPLLEYYESTPHEVIRLGANYGEFAVWAGNVLAKVGITGRYVVTDPDVVPTEECPLDLFGRLAELLDLYPNVLKVGIGLRIDDLPDVFEHKREVIDWEAQFWLEQIEPGVFYADVGSTFALYREGCSALRLAPALRTGAPYLARHLPWYDDSTRLSEEETFYRDRASPNLTNWNREQLPDPLYEALSTQRAQTRLREETKLLMPWVVEPSVVDEREFTPWADAGWHSWNDQSPEVEFCDFVEALVHIMAPSVVLETGVGQGYVTRRVDAALKAPGQRLVGFESDADLRNSLSYLPFFQAPGRTLADAAVPSASDYAAADLTILDSHPDVRWQEIEAWHAHARDGAGLLVHDTGNKHPESTIHARNAGVISALGIAGVFLKNPRGSFLGFRAGRAGTLAVADAIARAEAAEAALRAIRATRSYRWLQPARRARGWWLRNTSRR